MLCVYFIMALFNITTRLHFRLTVCKMCGALMGICNLPSTHLINQMSHVCRQPAPTPALSYLRAGQFGLGEHQRGGVDGVGQLLLNQLVGLGCLTDPGEAEGGGNQQLRDL